MAVVSYRHIGKDKFLANYREEFHFEAPIDVVSEWLKEAWPSRDWKTLKQEHDYFLMEEKMPNDVPYHRSSFIGPARVEISIRPTSTGTVITGYGQNEYYGDDPPPINKYDLLNGQRLTQSSIQYKITAAKSILDNKFKEWSAQQRYQRSEEQRNKQEHQKTNYTPTDSSPYPASCYQILGLPESCTKKEASDKVHQLAMDYHPDRVSHMAPEFRELANSKMKEFNGAYEQLKRLRGW